MPGARAKNGSKAAFKPMRKPAAKGAGKGRAQVARPKARVGQRRTKRASGGYNPMGNAMHPQSKVLIPTSIRSGDAFSISGIVRPLSLDCATGDRKIIAVTNFGSSGTIMKIVSTNGVNVSRTSLTVPLMATAGDSGGPTSARAMKAGLHLVNTTPLLNRCGRVYHLNGTSRVSLPALPSLMTAAQWNTFSNDLIAMPNATPYEGEHFGGAGRHFQCNSVDNVDYEDFTAFSGTDFWDSWWGHVAIWPGLNPFPRPMSTCWVIIESPTQSQTYNPTASAMWYTRWPLTSVPGQNMKPIPTADNQVINAMHSMGEFAANLAHNPVVEGIERAVGRMGRTGMRGLGNGIAGALGRM